MIKRFLQIGLIESSHHHKLPKLYNDCEYFLIIGWNLISKTYNICKNDMFSLKN